MKFLSLANELLIAANNGGDVERCIEGCVSHLKELCEKLNVDFNVVLRHGVPVDRGVKLHVLANKLVGIAEKVDGKRSVYIVFAVAVLRAMQKEVELV